MSSASVNAAQLTQTLTSSLRNLEKFINSRPSTWSKDRKDDKVLFITASYTLIDLLSKDPKFEEYRKKEYIGDAVFLWLKYLAKRPEVRASPETVNLGRFNHDVFSAPIEIPLLSGKPYTPHPSLSQSKEQSPSVAPVKPPVVIAKNTSTQATKNVRAPNRGQGSDSHENDEETLGKESTKGVAAKKAPKGGVGKGKQVHGAETGDDDAMDVDGEETSAQRRTKKSTKGREDEGLSWNAKDDSDDSYQGSDDDDDETDSDSAKRIKKDVAKKKATSKTPSVPVKRNRADNDSAPGAAKRSKSSVPDGYYEARAPCTTCNSKRQSCFINKPRVACFGCKPPGQKRIATCNFSSRRRKGQGDDGGKDAAEDASTVNDEDIEDNVEEAVNSASAIAVKRTRQDSAQDTGTDTKKAEMAEPPNRLDIVVREAWARQRGSADAKGQRGGDKVISPSAPSTVGDGTSAKTGSTKSSGEDKTVNLSRVAPAGSVELPLPTVDRTVTRLLMENARQQSSINYLTATLEVLLEDAKEYEKVLAKAAMQETRIANLEAQVEAAEKEIKRMHEERDEGAKALGALNKGNTERLQWLASTVTVLNNWVAAKMKMELGDTFVPPTDTTINGVQIPMPLVTNPTSPPQSTPVTARSPSSTTCASNPPVQDGQDSANQGGLLQFIKFPDEGPLGAPPNGHASNFLNVNGLQETEEVERLMRED